VRLKVHVYASPGRKWGERVYKVGRSGRDVDLLQTIGWRVVHRPRGWFTYVYMQAPEDGATRDPVVEVDLPDQAAVIELAHQVHARGERWRGDILGWPAQYSPASTSLSRCHVFAPGGGYEGEPTVSRMPAMFQAGDLNWNAYLTWDDGVDAPPRVSFNEENVQRLEVAAG
jgi:hypothetical protein